MVVKMMRWRPWPPMASKKFEVKLAVLRLEGLHLLAEDGGGEEEKPLRLMVEVRWKGPKVALGSLRQTVKKNFTREVQLRSDGVVEWDEEFQNVCSLSDCKESASHPWDISLTALKGVNQGTKNKFSVIGTATLNLAEFASLAEGKHLEMNLPLSMLVPKEEFTPSLNVTISLSELKSSAELAEMLQKPIRPSPQTPPSPQSRAAPSIEKDERSALKAGIRKVRILKEYVVARKLKKACQEDEGSEDKSSARSEDAEYSYPFDSDSLDDFEEGDLEEGKEDSSFSNSLCYGNLASANIVGGYSEMRTNGEGDDWVYYKCEPDVNCLNFEETSSTPEQPRFQISRRTILPWKKRKLSFRSPKAKGEPLLKKSYGDDGGDDIDHDRRQLSSSDESCVHRRSKAEGAANETSVSEFGDDLFAVGTWEQKEIVSRDGQMKLCTQAFFASIDQRSEQAAGGSACTALVSVIADWLHSNPDVMPIKSQLDSLIREGSLEWRNLCEDATYKERFPDKHLDLDTVLQAKIRPLDAVPGKSFIGFFHPDGMEDGFNFLHGAMSFDSIWDEISRSRTDPFAEDGHKIYIVSWNDHFFVLKVDPEAYYIIDTLGERLYEGCNQAYILKFDRDTTICRLADEAVPEVKPATERQAPTSGSRKGLVQRENKNVSATTAVAREVSSPSASPMKNASENDGVILCRGKEACKEYIKSFLAAIPLRELQADIKKGRMISTPLHTRLQIEFNFTKPLHPVAVVPLPAPEIMEPALAMAATAMPPCLETAVVVAF